MVAFNDHNLKEVWSCIVERNRFWWWSWAIETSKEAKSLKCELARRLCLCFVWCWLVLCSSLLFVLLSWVVLPCSLKFWFSCLVFVSVVVWKKLRICLVAVLMTKPQWGIVDFVARMGGTLVVSLFVESVSWLIGILFEFEGSAWWVKFRCYLVF